MIFFMIIQVFSSSMIFPGMELFLVIFHDFQSLWEPLYIHIYYEIAPPNWLKFRSLYSINNRKSIERTLIGACAFIWLNDISNYRE